MADQFKEQMQAKYDLDDDELALIDEIFSFADRIEAALFITFQAADARPGTDRRELRAMSMKAWREIAESAIEFAVEK
jgi:hypothetical protein